MKMGNLEKLVKGDKKGSATRMLLDKDEMEANKIKGTGIMAGGRMHGGFLGALFGGDDDSDDDDYADAKAPTNGKPPAQSATKEKKRATRKTLDTIQGPKSMTPQRYKELYTKIMQLDWDQEKKAAAIAELNKKRGGSVKIGKSRFGKPSVDRAKHNLKGGAVAQLPDGSYQVIHNTFEPTVRKHKGEGLVAGGRASKAKSARCRQAAEDLAECQPWTIAARNKEEQPKRGPSKRKNLVIDPAEDPEGPKKGQKIRRRGKAKPMQLSTPKKGPVTRSQAKGSGIYGGPRRASGSGYRGGGPSGGAIGAAERVGNVGAGGNLIGGTRMGHGALASQAQYSNPFFSTQFPPGMQTM